MERIEAQEHLELVGKILSRAETKFNALPSLFIVWGSVSALACIIWQLILVNNASMDLLWVWAAAIIAAVFNHVMVIRDLVRSGERISWLGRQISRMFGATFGVTTLFAIGAPQIFLNWSSAALFSVAAAIATFFIAQQGDRRALVATIILAASVIAASWYEPWRGYLLAAGWIFGYAGLGVAYAVTRDNG